MDVVRRLETFIEKKLRTLSEFRGKDCQLHQDIELTQMKIPDFSRVLKS